MITELFSLEGRVALVTGGNGGLGRAIARGLSSAGAKAAVTGRSEAKNADPSIEFGPDRVFALDMRDEVAIEETISPISERLGGLDILVNNAGLTRGGDSLELTREAWEEVIGTHLTGSFLCSKHAARAMKSRRRGGKIINIGSMYTMFGAARAADYAAAKTGMLGLVRSLAIEFAPSGIQVNAILPGWYETDLTRGLLGKPVGEQIRRRTPARRWACRTISLARPSSLLRRRRISWRERTSPSTEAITSPTGSWTPDANPPISSSPIL